MSEFDIAKLINEDKIDILIDLCGLIDEGRIGMYDGDSLLSSPSNMSHALQCRAPTGPSADILSGLSRNHRRALHGLLYHFAHQKKKKKKKLLHNHTGVVWMRGIPSLLLDAASMSATPFPHLPIASLRISARSSSSCHIRTR
jgi:hypothetical protein